MMDEWTLAFLVGLLTGTGITVQLMTIHRLWTETHP